MILEFRVDWNGTCEVVSARKELNPVRNVASVVMLLLILTVSSFAAPAVLKASAAPEPGVLVALGSGLVGLATFIRRRFNQ